MNNEQDKITVRPYDDQDYIEFMNGLKGKKVVACIEQVGAMPGQGVTSMVYLR